MKICRICKIEKPFNDFYKNKAKPLGLQRECKKCDKAKNKIYSDNNKQRSQEYYLDNKEQIREVQDEWRKNNPEYDKQYYSDNKEELQLKSRSYRSEHKEERAIYENKKIKTDIQYKLAKYLRARLRSAIKNKQKSGSAVDDLGMSIEDFQQHLEKQFYNNPETGEAMNWDNYGYHGWHIDHKRPLSSFDLENREEFLQATHYSNQQPMWAKENFQKGDKWNPLDNATLTV